MDAGAEAQDALDQVNRAMEEPHPLDAPVAPDAPDALVAPDAPDALDAPDAPAFAPAESNELRRDKPEDGSDDKDQ
jgi:hypothetical protein